MPLPGWPWACRFLVFRGSLGPVLGLGQTTVRITGRHSLMERQEIKELIMKELPDIIKQDEEVRRWIIKLGRDQFGDREQYQARFDRMMDELAEQGRQSDLRWEETLKARRGRRSIKGCTTSSWRKSGSLAEDSTVPSERWAHGGGSCPNGLSAMASKASWRRTSGWRSSTSWNMTMKASFSEDPSRLSWISSSRTEFSLPAS